MKPSDLRSKRVTAVAVQPSVRRTAAISRPLQVHNRGGKIRSRFDGLTEQQLVRHYDDKGPSWLGQYLDEQANLIAMMPFKLQLFNPVTGMFEWAEDARVAGILETNLKGWQSEATADFVRALARDILAVGEVALVRFDTKLGDRWRVLPMDADNYVVIKKDEKKQPSILGWPLEEGATVKQGEPAFTQAAWVDTFRIYQPKPTRPREAVSPVWRVLPDIRRFDLATRALHRLVASLLRLNKILVFKGTQKDLGFTHPGGQEELGPLGEQLDSMLEASSRSLKDFDEDDQASTLPGIWISEDDKPISVIDVGSPVDPQLMDLKQDALNDAARGLPGPRSALVDGEGAAHRMLNDNNLRAAIYQSLRPTARVVAHGLTIAVAHRHLPQGVPKDHVRVWFDELDTMRATPSIDDVMRAADGGHIASQPIRDILNLPNSAPELPPGMTECEFQIEMRRGRRSTSWLEALEDE